MFKTTCFILLMAVSFTAAAQSHTTTVEYQKIKRDAITADLPFPEKLVAGAIEDTLQKLGYKGKDSKGYTVYKGVKLYALGRGEYDLYFAVNGKGKKDKDNSVVTLMLSKGFDEFITEKSDGSIVKDAKTYLDSLRNIVAVYELEQRITEQDEVVKKNEKRSNSLTEDAADLQKEKKKLEKKIEDNLKEQEKQVKEMEVQKQVLETLRGKRRA
jgi:hypothetical protein